MQKKHSVLLKEDKCEGCTNCVKNCPTRAIRVHQGKATIKEELCIDCAECIRTCEYHAKYTSADSLDMIEGYSCPVLLLPPSFYGQFHFDKSLQTIINSIYELGFKRVYNVARAAEAVSWKTAKFLNDNQGFYISSSCPVIVRLIKNSYPELLEHLIPFKSPVELMAQKVKNDLIKQKDYPEEDIGVFFLTPCPAKLTTVESPLAMEKSYLDGAFAVDRIYEKILPVINKNNNNKHKQQKEKDDLYIPYSGIRWGQSGGEIEVLKNIKPETFLSVAGINEVEKILEEIYRNNIEGIKYFELVSCPQGCVGGVLNVNNPYQAKYNIRKMTDLNKSSRTIKNNDFDFYLPQEFKAENVGRLDQDMDKAMEKLTRMENEIELLPGLDCAACGAPDCETLAEDIVQGKARRMDCIFMLRKEIQQLAEQISSFTQELPPVMSEKKGDDDN